MPGLLSNKHHNGFVETTACRHTQYYIPHGACTADSWSQNVIILNTTTIYVTNKKQRTFHFMSLFRHDRRNLLQNLPLRRHPNPDRVYFKL